MSADDKSTSIWKKEISFRRKPAGDDLDLDVGVDDAGVKTSIWKREISLGRKKGEEPVEPEGPAAAPEPVAEVPAPAPEPVAEEPEPPAPAPVAPIEHDWLTQPLEEVSEPPAPTPITLVPPPEPLPPIAPVPDPEPEAEPEPPAPQPAAVVPAPEFPGIPSLPPAAAAPPPPVAPVEHPAVEPPPAVELPTVELPPMTEPMAEAPVADVPTPPQAEEPKVPFYKKELSFKRAPKAPKAPKPAKQPKAEEPKAEKQPKEPKPPKDPNRKPFYKRDLSFKRAPKQWDAAEPAAPAKPKLARLPRPALPSLSRGGGGGAGSTKKLVGLKIGGSQIAAARVHNNGVPELVQAARMTLEPGIVVGGELRDPESLATALKDFFAQHKLPKRGVRLGIANNRIGVRTFDVTGIADPKQLANAVRFRAQEVLPIPIEQAVLDYQVLDESVNDEGQPVRRVLLVVAYRELVDRYVLACRKAGIQVVGIDLEAFALLRALSEPREHAAAGEHGAVVVVSVGHDRSTFAVSDGRICEFTRVLEWGGAALNVAIARALDIAPSEAAPLKHALSLNGVDAAPEGFGEQQLATAREVARQQLQTFARELVSSLQFYQNQPGSLGIGEILVTGGTAHLPGLGAELERLIGVPVRVADPLARVKVPKKLQTPEQVGSLAIAIGLGIED
jgi:type IV pilus assembly protein PilM